MPSVAIKTGKSHPKNIPTPPQHPSFLLGSRPGSLRSPAVPAVPRIKPAASSERQYGKDLGGAQIAGLTPE